MRKMLIKNTGRCGEYTHAGTGITFPENDAKREIGSYGRQHLNYIKKHHYSFYFQMLNSGKLHSYLTDINKQALNTERSIVQRMAKVESNCIIFNAWLNGQTDGFAYGELVNISNNAIYQYRDMYLRPLLYAGNEEKIKSIIASVIANYKNEKYDYDTACFEARIKIYQSINPNFNPDVEFAKDTCYRDIPAYDNSLFIISLQFPLN